MRCSCKECGTYMIQAESDRLGCVCPDCGYRCRDCLGTDTVISREAIRGGALELEIRRRHEADTENDTDEE